MMNEMFDKLSNLKFGDMIRIQRKGKIKKDGTRTIFPVEIYCYDYDSMMGVHATKEGNKSATFFAHSDYGITWRIIVDEEEAFNEQ